MKKEDIKVVEDIEEVEAEQEEVEQTGTIQATVLQDSNEDDEVTIEVVKRSNINKLKAFGRKHWKAIAGAAAVGTAALLVAKASKKDNIIDGEFEEVMDTFDYDAGYTEQEEVEEESDTKVEEEA